MIPLHVIRHSIRGLINNFCFSVFTSIILSLGLGLCLYMFTVIDVLALKPLPFNEGERMVMITPSINGVRLGDSPMYYDEYKSIKEQATTLDSINFYRREIVNVKINDTVLRYNAIRTTNSFFQYTDITPVIGREFDNHDIEGGVPVAIISFSLWEKHYNKSKSILTDDIYINGIKTKIIGVMPEYFEFPISCKIWLPSFIENNSGGIRTSLELFVIAKIKQHVTSQQVDSQLTQIMKNVAESKTDSNAGRSSFSISFTDSFIGEDAKPIIIIMLATILSILILIVSNVGNLLLLRANEQKKSTAIKIVLGMPSSHLLISSVTEGVFLAVLGACGGILLAHLGLSISNELLKNTISDNLPFWWDLSLDKKLIIQTFTLSIILGIVTGLFPFLSFLNNQMGAILLDGSKGGGSQQSMRFSYALIVFEITLSIIVICVAFQLILSVFANTRVDYGVKPDHIYTAKVTLPSSSYNSKKAVNFFSDLASRLESNANIKRVGMISRLPGEFSRVIRVQVEGELSADLTEQQYRQSNDVVVFPETLNMLGIKALSGRLFSKYDNVNSRNVVIVTQSFVEQYVGRNVNIIGKRLKIMGEGEGSWYTVIGVIPHVIQGSPFGYSRAMPTVYRSFLQEPRVHMSILTVPYNKNEILQNIKYETENVDPMLTAYRFISFGKVMENNMIGLSYLSNIFNLFAIVACAIAVSGVYAVMAKVTSQRQKEISIRQTLGATDINLIMMLFSKGIKLMGVSLLLGVPVSIVFCWSLIEIINNEPIWVFAMIISTVLILCSMIFLVMLPPILHAVRINPIRHL